MIASARPNQRAKGHRAMNTRKDVPVAVAPLAKRGAIGRYASVAEERISVLLTDTRGKRSKRPQPRVDLRVSKLVQKKARWQPKDRFMLFSTTAPNIVLLRRVGEEGFVLGTNGSMSFPGNISTVFGLSHPDHRRRTFEKIEYTDEGVLINITP